MPQSVTRPRNKQFKPPTISGFLASRASVKGEPTKVLQICFPSVHQGYESEFLDWRLQELGPALKPKAV